MKAGPCTRHIMPAPLLAYIISFLLFSIFASAGEVKLAWDPNTEPELKGYRLYYGTASGQYKTILDVGNITTYTIKDLPAGTYYFAVRAYSADIESAYSNEVSATISGDITLTTNAPEIALFTDAETNTRVTQATTSQADRRPNRNRSRNISGNRAFPGESVSTIKKEKRDLALPRLSAAKDMLGENTMTGLALVNVDSKPASITLTSMDNNGKLTAGEEITNPVIQRLNPGNQLALFDWELFGNGISRYSSNGWIKLENSASDLNGFFLIFDNDLNLMDGANLAGAQLTDCVFSEIQENGANWISVINNNPYNTNVSFNLVRADGTIRRSRTRLVAPNGSLSLEIFRDLFAGTEPHATDYVSIKSGKGVQSFQVMRQKSGDIAILAGQDPASGATRLYAPQYVIGGAADTDLSVINLDARAGKVTFRLIGEDGVQMGATKTLAIPARGKLHIADPGFFLISNSDAIKTGYVEIASNGIRLGGSIVFRDRNGETFISALTLISTLQNSVLFAHLPSTDSFYTGLAILNPNPDDAVVSIELYSANGIPIDIKSELISAKHSVTRLLTEFFPSLNGKNQVSAYLKLVSNQAIAAFALFGTTSLSVLSSIPPH
ncbi:MAG: fibronectin type III domain-containing protein [Acidobacteria bacterium]|nr:fibronectin type III domain-containing protein [Acidobacteriota bacterium]